MNHKIIIFLVLLPSLAFAQGSSTGAASLKLPGTPFIGATSESFIADPGNVQSILINPANLASCNLYSGMFSHTEWLQDVRTEYLSVSAPFSFGSFSFSIGNTSVDNIPIYGDQPGNYLGSFNSQSTFFQLSYGMKVSESISIGIAPKYLYEKIYVDEATGWGIDLGALYNPSIAGLTLGLAATNLGSLSAFRNEKTDLPAQIRAGGTYSIAVDAVTIRAAAAYSSELNNSIKHLCIGTEFTYNKVISARLGYQTGYESRDLSAGLGLVYNIFSLDYAYIPWSSQMGNSHIISLTFNF